MNSVSNAEHPQMVETPSVPHDPAIIQLVNPNLDSVNHIEAILAQNRQLHREHDFLMRIMTQAVLTHGGMLHIDVKHAPAALARNLQLEFNSSGVTIHKSKDSLWPNAGKDQQN